jgi:hypothetical protein
VASCESFIMKTAAASGTSLTKPCRWKCETGYSELPAASSTDDN